MIKLIIFDLDGTLVNAYDAVALALNKVLQDLNIPQVDDLTIQRSVGWGEGHLLGCFVPDARLDEAVALYRNYHKELLPDNVRFLPSAKELVEGLKKKQFTLAVATNRPIWSTTIILETLNIKDEFALILSGENVEKQKPEPDVILEVVNRLSYKKEEALYVGDMTVDAKAGRAAGIKTVIVTTGSSTEEEIAQENPSKIVSDVYKVIEFIEEENCTKA